MRAWLFSILSIAGVSCSAVQLSAAEWNVEELTAVVHKSADSFVAAFQSRNAAEIAQLFTESAEYVEADGTVFHGRDAIQAEYAAMLAVRPGGELSIELTSIRPVADNVLIEEGLSTFQPEGEDPVTQTRYTATHIKTANDGWKLASVRELEATELSAHEHLKSLGWLVGSWRDEAVDTVVNTTWDWSPSGTFLVAEFDVRRGAEDSLMGTHRVGWDPQAKTFRSWVFDQSGGFAEGLWSRKGNAWSIALTATLADGSTATTTLVYERDGADAMVVSQRNRSRAGEDLPDFSTRVVRSPPPPSSVSE